MNLNHATLIEPYEDSSKAIGFIVTDRFGQIEDYPNEKWSVLKEREVSIFDKMLRGCPFWKLPAKPDVQKMKSEMIPPGNIQGPERMMWVRYKATEILTGIRERIETNIRTFVHLQNDADYKLLSNFVISTYFIDQLPIGPMAIVDGVSGSGKTTLLKVVSRLSYRGLLAGSYSEASLSTIVDRYHTSLFLDESKIAYENRNRGQDIYGFMLNVCVKDETRTRMDKDGDPSLINSFTSCMMATRGVVFQDDVVNRAIIIRLEIPCYGFDFERHHVDRYSFDDPMYEARTIRADLTALKILTEANCHEKPMEEKPGIWIGSWIDDSFREMMGKVRNSSYNINGISVPPSIVSSRLRDIAEVYYTIGSLTGTSDQMLNVVLDNYHNVRESNESSPEAMAANALLNLVRERVGRISRTGTDPEELLTPRECDIRDVSAKICTRDVYREYKSMCQAEDREVCMNSINFANTLKGFKIKLVRGAQNKSFIDANSPDYITRFRRIIEQYGYEENKRFFSGRGGQ